MPKEPLAKRGITVTHDSIRQWCGKFGPEYARKLKRRQGRLGDMWHLDEVFVKIGGERHYLWRAVDQDGDVIDILVQRFRNARAAKRFLRKLLKGQESKPWQLVTDKLRSYGAAHRTIMPSVDHNTDRYANNLADLPLRRPRYFSRISSPRKLLRITPGHSSAETSSSFNNASRALEERPHRSPQK